METIHFVHTTMLQALPKMGYSILVKSYVSIHSYHCYRILDEKMQNFFASNLDSNLDQCLDMLIRRDSGQKKMEIITNCVYLPLTKWNFAHSMCYFVQ